MGAHLALVNKVVQSSDKSPCLDASSQPTHAQGRAAALTRSAMADGGKGGDEYLFKVLVVGAVTPNAPPRTAPAHFTPTGCHGLAVGMGNGGQGQRTAQAGPGQRRAARQGGHSLRFWFPGGRAMSDAPFSCRVP